MFTAEQIMAAHGKVKSGADFPAYIREIKALGVTQYECYVSDGHIDYHGANGHTAKAPAKYEPLVIAGTLNEQKFRADLKAHQQGQSGFLEFIRAAASYGIASWAISMEKMTCTYYDTGGNAVLVEQIPQVSP